MGETDTNIRGRRHRWAIAFSCAGIAAAVAAFLLMQSTPLRTREGPPPVSLSRSACRQPIDESGIALAQQGLTASTFDATSLESIRKTYHRIGYRQMEALRAQPAGPPEQQAQRLTSIALLYGYEGDFLKASEALQQARAIVDRDPARYAAHRPTLIYLQGLMALRHGEVDNCVACCCQGSCIFPLQPPAFHQQRDGSMQAIHYFTEYLQGCPDDLGVRWLLNLAHMTLGEFPSGVPEAYRLPLDAAKSEFDIGRFVDIAQSLGLDRLHRSGGAIMDDFDNDGWLDLVESSLDPEEETAFFRNQGDGTFRNRTKGSGLENQTGALQCMQTDYNNDGWLDIFLCRGAWTLPQRPSLLRNNKDGTFTDVTREAGLLTPINSQAAAWADYDNDGRLDLFIGGESIPNLLYRNRGDGTFEEVAKRAGVADSGTNCKGVNWGDCDGDGYPDLLVSHLSGPPRLYRNNKNGTFTDVSASAGVTQPTAAFSCWFWDYDNDGLLDIFICGYESDLDTLVKSQLGMEHHQGRICRLYRNRGGWRFQDVTRAAGLDMAMSPMGTNFGDFDGDGYLDFYLGTGTSNYSALVPNRMFKNVGGQRFADITRSSGTGHLQKGHGVACGDWDRNGSIDLFVQMGGAIPGDRARSLFFQNPIHDRHWITVRLAGKKSNRPGIGARIRATLASGQKIYRHVSSGSSFGANPLQQTIGFAAADKLTELEIHWPTSGTTQLFRDVPLDQAIEVTEFAANYLLLNWKPLEKLTQNPKSEIRNPKENSIPKNKN